jgi:hypothetical protein
LNGNLLVATGGDNKIGEYTLAGAVVNSSLITGLDGPVAIVVATAAVPEPRSIFLGVLAMVVFWRLRVRQLQRR